VRTHQPIPGAPRRPDLTRPSAQPAGAVKHRKPRQNAKHDPRPTLPAEAVLDGRPAGAATQTDFPSPTEHARAPDLGLVG
jgi:hypothetical protein